MRAEEFQAAQRAREWFHGLTIPPGMWAVLRADGRGFSPDDRDPRQHDSTPAQSPCAALVLAPRTVTADMAAPPTPPVSMIVRPSPHDSDQAASSEATGPDPDLLREATAIYQRAASCGERLSQRGLARQLRLRGHRFPNDHLRQIAETAGLAHGRVA